MRTDPLYDEVEWCYVNGVPRHGERKSDWDRHALADERSDAGRHGTMRLVSPSVMDAETETLFRECRHGMLLPHALGLGRCVGASSVRAVEV